MKREADKIRGYNGLNPFKDIQGKNFSDAKISTEFCPTASFWSLFNDQHEIIIGTRGSGKTFLLKMMRYSMLKTINDPKAKELIENKNYIALYIPMHLEFVTELQNSNLDENRKIEVFYFLFNCLLADSLIHEIIMALNEIEDISSRLRLSQNLAKSIYGVWFNDPQNIDRVSQLEDVYFEVNKIYYNFDIKKGTIDSIPIAFRRQLCSTLVSVKLILEKELKLINNPTWIVCIDEAEFLDEKLQICINSFFRSDSNRIALKVATLPYYHVTSKTLDPNVSVFKSNDFNYCLVDMDYDSKDFIKLTNKLCKHRLSTHLQIDNLDVDTLEDFLGTIGKEDLIDYYRFEMGDDLSTHSIIQKSIISELSQKRQTNVQNYQNQRKTIYDKFAPVYFVREMYKKSKKGNSKPGWYAGSNMVRKISQGNPRLFINIMCSLFEESCKTHLTPKAQHGILKKYAHEFCQSSQAIEKYGPLIYNGLEYVSGYLHNKTHNGVLRSSGNSFTIGFDAETFTRNKGWLQRAIAYSRLIVDSDSIINGLNADTKYTLSNAYAAEYWIPMRKDSTTKVPVIDLTNTYRVRNQITNEDHNNEHQLSLFIDQEELN